MFSTVFAILDVLGLVAFATTGALSPPASKWTLPLCAACRCHRGRRRHICATWCWGSRQYSGCASLRRSSFARRLARWASFWRISAGLTPAACALVRRGGLIGRQRDRTDVALRAGAHPAVAVALGVATATFGGILRDVLCGESPLILRREIYVTAALLGAGVFALALMAGVNRDVAMAAGGTACFLLRGVALARGWSLPRYRPRPPREA